MECLHALLAFSPPAPQQGLREQASLSDVPCWGPCPLLRLAASVRGHRRGHYGMSWEGGSTPCPCLSCLGAPARGPHRSHEHRRATAARAGSRGAEEGQRGRVARAASLPPGDVKQGGLRARQIRWARPEPTAHTDRHEDLPMARRQRARAIRAQQAASRHAQRRREACWRLPHGPQRPGSGHAGEGHFWASVRAPPCARVHDRHAGAKHARGCPLARCP
jgi:hypothetical protein